MKGFIDGFVHKVKDFYEKKYKWTFIFTILLLVLAIVQIGVQQTTTGSFLIKSISLKGGTTLTIYNNKTINADNLAGYLKSNFPKVDFEVRTLEDNGEQVGIIIDTSLPGENVDTLLKTIETQTGTLKPEQYNIDIIGSSLGSSFFKETIIALIVSFILMAIVVTLYFRVLVPSFAVILSAFSDIIVTMAIVNLMGMKISTAGLAAYLLLIGYSVDTDIILSVHMLKRTDVPVMSRVYRAIATGAMTTGTTLAAVTLGLIFTKSDVIREIMIILLIGLIIDLFNTWVQNVGILRLYMERVKGEKA